MIVFALKRYPFVQNLSQGSRYTLAIFIVILDFIIPFLVAGFITNLIIYGLSLEKMEYPLFTLSNLWFLDNLTHSANFGRLIGTGVFVVGVLFFLFSTFNFKPQNIYGDAKFSNNKEIKKANLREKEQGIVCGWTGNHNIAYFEKMVQKTQNHINKILRFGGSEHTICYAPSRAGKGIGIVIPNLLSWPDALVVLDIKKECFKYSAGWRQKCGYKVFVFDPLDKKSITYNPFTVIQPKDETKISEIDKIASFLIPLNSHQPFFDEAARKLFSALALYLFDVEKIPTIGNIFKLASKSTKENLQNLIKYTKSEETQNLLSDCATIDDKTFSSIRISLTTHLSLWKNPKICDVTSSSSLDLRKIKQEGWSIYITVNPTELDILKPLIALFFQQLINLQMKDLPDYDDANQLLLVMDEFTSIGKLSFIEKQISYLAGYGLRLLLIVQSPSQLRATYGENQTKTLLANCGLEIVFPTKELNVAEEISKRCGTRTVVKKHHKTKFSLENSYTEQQRFLILPQELMQMKKGNILLLRSGYKPIMANRFVFYNEKQWKERSLFKYKKQSYDKA